MKYVIIDRTVFLQGNPDDILAVQNVPPEIYEASYPVWFLSLEKFLEFIKKEYEVIFKWQALDQHKLANYDTIGLGFLLSRKH